MDKRSAFGKKLRLSLMFASVVFLILLATMIVVFALMTLLTCVGVLNRTELPRMPMLLFALISIVLGTILSIFFSSKPLKPFRAIMDATDRIADGDYSVRLDLKGPEELRILSDKFNHMAKELSSVEMLRSDFVNHFSHELKTPIVSIRGFAKALKWDDLTEDERSDYLDVIIRESERLCALSTNVLTLSKFEQQTILTDVRPFNLTEQIRRTIALLYNKWSEKHIDVRFDAEDLTYSGNAEMLHHVWINLLDNAVKFSPEGGVIAIDVLSCDSGVKVRYQDQGEGMSPDAIAHAFDKFYQGDPAHATQGNGLGLSIAQRIVALHKGKISVVSAPSKGSTFEIWLPVLKK